MLVDVLIGIGFIVLDIIAIFLTVLVLSLQIYYADYLKPVALHSFKRQVVLTNLILLITQSMVIVPMVFMNFRAVQAFETSNFFAYMASAEYLALCSSQTLLDFLFISCIMYYFSKTKRFHQLFQTVGIYLLMFVAYLVSSFLTGILYFVNCRFLYDDNSYSILNYCMNPNTSNSYNTFMKWYLCLGLFLQGVCSFVGIALFAKRTQVKVSERSGESATQTSVRLRFRRNETEIHKQLMVFFVLNLIRILLRLFIPAITEGIPSELVTRIVSSTMQFAEFLHIIFFSLATIYYDTEMRHIVSKLKKSVRNFELKDLVTLMPKFIRNRL